MCPSRYTRLREQQQLDPHCWRRCASSDVICVRAGTLVSGSSSSWIRTAGGAVPLMTSYVSEQVHSSPGAAAAGSALLARCASNDVICVRAGTLVSGSSSSWIRTAGGAVPLVTSYVSEQVHSSPGAAAAGSALLVALCLQ